MALFRGPKTSSSKSVTSPWNSGFSYDVFLSFRGEDTRKTFTDHLYTALDHAGFRTFRDDPELERGENIEQKLREAIQQSRSSVIVFSKDYTSSKWCLDELVMILERRRTSDHVVLPIFYDVDPSQLRKQADNLSKVPQYQENQSSEQLNGWRAALREVADLAGMVLKNEADGHESKFIQKLVTVVHDKIGRVPLSDAQEMLQKKLLSINTVLDDAEGKQLNNPKVKDWLDEHKEDVYDAEDLLQEIQTEVLRQKMAPESESSTSKAKELISSSPSHAFDPALIKSRVEAVLERLDCAQKDGKDVLGLEASAGHRVSQRIPSTCLVEDSVFGRDEEKETFIRLLLSDDAKISVIPIVGMGGIGKTTLAQLLYNDVRVKQHFDLYAWAYVSQEFDVHRISQHIYESLTSNTCQNVSLNLLQSNLKAAVEGKKFFFVLDDIWNESYMNWDLLRRPFESGAHGSKIIVTARNVDVASMVDTGTDQTHSLMPISEQDGWLLFEKHAFKNKGVGAYSNLEDIGRKIVSKCKGLPLALKSLGGLLCSNLSVRHWGRVLNSDIWAVENSDIMPALWVSYCYLPQCLKRCFAYCSIFPKGYEYEKSKLISLWKAEGLLQRTKEEVVEEVGEGYFNDLVSQSFFQLYFRHRNKSYYIMHDLINDLAKFVSGDFCVSWEDSESSKVVTSKTRHFAYMERYAESYEKFGALHKAEHLRSFLALTHKMVARPLGNYRVMDEVLYDLLPKLRYLRVLNLAECNIQELPDSINNLKLLRHLNMSVTPIRKLPDTICSLYNLQELLLSYCRSLTALPTNLGRLTNLSHLDIKGTNLKEMPAHMGLRYLRVLNLAECNIQELPDSIDNLKLLRQLNMSFTPIRKLPDTICSLYNLQELLLSGCPSLTALPTNLGRLTNLSHLDIEDTNLKEMPAHMGNLKDLQILNKFVLGKHNAGDSILELKELQNLRGRLCISGLGNIVNGSALEANILKDKKFLTELVLDGGSPWDWTSRWRTDVETQIESEVLDKLQPHAKLEYLSIRQYRGTNFPDWLRYFASSTLVYLKLEECINCTSLPPLGQLESLRELHLEQLHGVEAIGPEFYGRSTFRIKPFRSLQIFYVSGMRKLKEWSYVGDANDERGDFPNIRALSLLDCNKLTGELALDKFPLLESLYMRKTKLSFAMSRCPKLLALTRLDLICCPEIESFPDQGLDAPNLTDIVIEDCEKLRSLPEKMHTLLPSLRRLGIRLCPQLKSVPEGGLPSKLKSLVTACCGELIANPMQWGLQRLTSLERLSIHFSGCVVDSFPEEGLNLPRTLTHLSIKDQLNLKTINQKGFRHLDSLQRLDITNCPSLKCLPGERLPTSLHSLYINSCPLLIERCKREKGEDWPKISHIAYIYVERKRI